MKFEKKNLYYYKCSNGSYDIIIHNYPKQDVNENVCNWYALLKLYPKRKYFYIKLEGVDLKNG